MIFQQAGQREDIANIVIHHQNLLADQCRIRFTQLFQDALLISLESASARCSSSTDSSSSRSRVRARLTTLFACEPR